MNGIVYLNGEFIDAAAAKVSAFDRGFIFGDGIYEVVPVLNGRLVDREDFWERFERSLAAIELSLPLSKSDFQGILEEVVWRNNLKEGGVYMQITRGVADRDFKFIKGLKPTCFVFCYEKYSTKVEMIYNEAVKNEIPRKDLEQYVLERLVAQSEAGN